MLFAFDEIVHARAPERFQIQQMAGLFLHGPFLGTAPGEEITRLASKHLFKASGSPTKPYAEIGKQIGGEGKLEFAFKPKAGIAHGRSVTEVRRCRGEARQDARKAVWDKLVVARG